MFSVEGTSDLAPRCNVLPFVRTAGIRLQIQLSVKKNVMHFSSLSRVRGLGLLIEKNYNLIEKAFGRRYGGRSLRLLVRIRISTTIRFGHASENRRTSCQFESKLGVQRVTVKK